MKQVKIIEAQESIKSHTDNHVKVDIMGSMFEKGAGLVKMARTMAKNIKLDHLASNITQEMTMARNLIRQKQLAKLEANLLPEKVEKTSTTKGKKDISASRLFQREKRLGIRKRENYKIKLFLLYSAQYQRWRMSEEPYDIDSPWPYDLELEKQLLDAPSDLIRELLDAEMEEAKEKWKAEKWQEYEDEYYATHKDKYPEYFNEVCGAEESEPKESTEIGVPDTVQPTPEVAPEVTEVKEPEVLPKAPKTRGRKPKTPAVETGVPTTTPAPVPEPKPKPEPKPRKTRANNKNKEQTN